MELLSSLSETPLPTILVIGGVFLLILAVVTELDGKIKIKPQRQKIAAVFGIVLILVGVLLYLLPGTKTGSASSPSPQPTPGTTARLLVVRTTPANNSTNIDPGLSTIEIVFSEAVSTESWSFVEAYGGEVPEITGDPTFPDSRTCLLPVRLQAAKTYSLGINSPSHKGFVSAGDSRLAVEPYTLLFSTAP